MMLSPACRSNALETRDQVRGVAVCGHRRGLRGLLTLDDVFHRRADATFTLDEQLEVVWSAGGGHCGFHCDLPGGHSLVERLVERLHAVERTLRDDLREHADVAVLDC